MTAHACPPVRLVNAGTLFTYLDPALTADGPLPATSNSIEGGVNAQLRVMLRDHRGLSIERRIKAVFWWCCMRSPDPLPAEEYLLRRAPPPLQLVHRRGGAAGGAQAAACRPRARPPRLLRRRFRRGHGHRYRRIQAARRLVQGPLARRRCVRGHFRRAQGLALPRQGLVGLDGGALHRQALSVRVQAFGRCTEEDGEPACQIVISPIGRKLVNLVFDQRDRESSDEERSRFVQWFAEDLGLSLTAKNREVGPSMHDGSSDELVGTC